MNQKTYLEQLGNALSEAFPQKEAEDVLSDYADFFASGALFLISGVRGCRKSRWFLFLDTFLLSEFAAIAALLSCVPGGSLQNPTAVIFGSFLWAILPNLAALVIFWAVLKVRKQRREKVWKAR